MIDTDRVIGKRTYVHVGVTARWRMYIHTYMHIVCEFIGGEQSAMAASNQFRVATPRPVFLMNNSGAALAVNGSGCTLGWPSRTALVHFTA